MEITTFDRTYSGAQDYAPLAFDADSEWNYDPDTDVLYDEDLLDEEFDQ